MKISDGPPPDTDQFGIAHLDRVRLRKSFFGLKFEELCERPDGSRFWRRARIGDWVEFRSQINVTTDA